MSEFEEKINKNACCSKMSGFWWGKKKKHKLLVKCPDFDGGKKTQVSSKMSGFWGGKKQKSTS